MPVMYLLSIHIRYMVYDCPILQQYLIFCWFLSNVYILLFCFRSMGEAGGYWDGFVNGDDSFHNVINMLDFPLESVEEDKCVAEENWDAQFPSLGPFSSEIVQEFTPVFRSDFTEDVPYSFIEVNFLCFRQCSYRNLFCLLRLTK